MPPWLRIPTSESSSEESTPEELGRSYLFTQQEISKDRHVERRVEPKRRYRIGWCFGCVLVVSVVMLVSFATIGIEHKIHAKAASPFGDDLDYEHGVSMLQKYLEGDISTSQLLESIENKAKLIATLMKVLLSRPELPGFYPDVDPSCLSKEKYYYRTYDGTCNWLRKGEAWLGAAGQPFGRDTPGHYYADGYNAPRMGPNVRELSNTFFNRSNVQLKFWEHTQYLIGFVEFLVHDILLSPSGREAGDSYNIPVPQCDSYFDPNCTGKKVMPFYRNKKVNGTGVPGTPREFVNDATIWLDLGTIYGSSKEQNAKLRTFVDGKLILDPDGYLPLNDRFNFDMIWRYNKSDIFAAGDPRANQDFLLQAWQTLMVKQHNRICDILVWKYPDWDDEQLFLTARTITSCQFSVVGSAYFIAYFKETMPYPATPFSIYDLYTGENTIPTKSFPWHGSINPDSLRPDPLPNEFSVGYRWHDLLPDHIVHPETNEKVDLVTSAWSASKFKNFGLDNIFQAMAMTSIPDFQSGLSDGYRNIQYSFRDPNQGINFDLAAWAIEHERERGLPTFNTWARHYRGKVPIKVRETFEDFTSNPFFVAELKRLYKTPDDVDLFVGQELDETRWPHTYIPTSVLAISFYTLFKGSTADRFALNYNIGHCLIEQKPWNCRPNNILQEILWKQAFPDNDHVRIPDTFWLKEFDLANKGTTLLRKIVSQNTPLKCLQENLYFLPHPERNPTACWDINEIPGPSFSTMSRYTEAVKLLLSYGKLNHFYDLTQKYGPVVKIGVAGGLHRTLVLLNRIDDFDTLFGKGESNFMARNFPDYFRLTYGQIGGYSDGKAGYGISNIDGEEWKRRRWIHNTYIRPQFGSYLPIIVNHAQELVDVFYHNSLKPFSPFEAVRSNYMDIMAELSYGRKYLDSDAGNKSRLFEAYKFWLSLGKSPKPTKLEETKPYMDFIHKFAKTLIEQKIATGDYGTDWVGVYLSTPSYDGKLIAEEGVLSIPFDYSVGNMGSGVFALTFALWNLAKYPDIQEKAYREIMGVAGSGPLTLNHIHQLTYLRAVVMEGLRLIPSGGTIGGGRMSAETAVVEGYQIPAKVIFLTHAYLIQNNKRYWGDNPQQFDPQRWINSPRPNPDYAFTTFGAGEKGCAGKDFAILQLSVNLAYIIRNFNLVKADDDIFNYDYVKRNIYMTAFSGFEKLPEITMNPRSPPS